jgi:hypothetical protein
MELRIREGQTRLLEPGKNNRHLKWWGWSPSAVQGAGPDTSGSASGGQATVAESGTAALSLTSSYMKWLVLQLQPLRPLPSVPDDLDAVATAVDRRSSCCGPPAVRPPAQTRCGGPKSALTLVAGMGFEPV